MLRACFSVTARSVVVCRAFAGGVPKHLTGRSRNTAPESSAGTISACRQKKT